MQNLNHRFRIYRYIFPLGIFSFGLVCILKQSTFSTLSFPQLSLDDIPRELSVNRELLLKKFPKYGIPLCPFLIERKEVIADEILSKNATQIEGYGGEWISPDCHPVHKVALIIPYRDRPNQLEIFLRYINTFLQIQKISYRIFVIEQVDTRPFNRGTLLNIGFLEASDSFGCFIFHDVDLLPEVLYNIYGCTSLPRHMSVTIDSFRYTLLYERLFGGAVAITREQFIQVNGMSNRYFGWGGEDDDFYRRLNRRGIEISRFPASISSYRMLPHKKEAPNLDRFNVLISGSSEEDGLTNTNYIISDKKIVKLCTLIQVAIM